MRVVTAAGSRTNQADEPGYIAAVRTAKAALLVALCLATGVGMGLWNAWMTYPCTAFCLYPEPRFAIWQSCLVGVGAGASVLAIVCALGQDLVRRGAASLRVAWHFLFDDLSRRQIP